MGRRASRARATAERSETADEARGPARLAMAPMAPVFVLVTGVLLAIPVIWILAAITRSEMRTNAIAMASAFVAAAIAVFVAMRPTHFVIDEARLTIVFPVRSTSVERATITHARVLPRSELSAVMGWPWRVGVGGLFGNFGLLWTSKRGWVTTYLTTRDAWVLIERSSGRPLLVSPADPQAFLRAIA